MSGRMFPESVAECFRNQWPNASGIPIQLGKTIYGDGAAKGHGSYLPAHVKPILRWYNSKQNKKNIETFLNGYFQGTKAATRLNQFIEMFVTHEDLSLVKRICESEDTVFYGGTDLGTLNHENIYEEWKFLKANPKQISQLTPPRKYRVR